MYVGSTPTSNPQGPHRPRTDLARETRPESGTAAVNASSPSAAGPAAVSSGASETVRLLEQLRAVPEIRTGLMEQVKTRLEQGAYLTRDAAEQTAATLLGNPSS